jgi:5'-nucleotidase
MRFILTNDDGIDAPGLLALQQALAQAIEGAEATIVAPLLHHSGCSHQVTTHRPIRVEQRSDSAYAVEGTPADCIRVALSHLKLQPTYVLSGINAGGNLGADLYISGTVAAIREAALHRIPGIAISHYIHRRQPINWERAADLAALTLRSLIAQPQLSGSFWNVNLPHLESDKADPELVFCPLCTQPLPAVYQLLETGALQYAGEYGKRDRDRGSDVEVCFSGQIAITAIQLWGSL